MIGYEMPNRDKIDWVQARDQFQRCIARKLRIQQLTLQVEGIVSENGIWFIVRSTDALVNAFNSVVPHPPPPSPSPSPSFWSKVGTAVSFALLALVAILSRR